MVVSETGRQDDLTGILGHDPFVWDIRFRIGPRPPGDHPHDGLRCAAVGLNHNWKNKRLQNVPESQSHIVDLQSANLANHSAINSQSGTCEDTTGWRRICAPVEYRGPQLEVTKDPQRSKQVQVEVGVGNDWVDEITCATPCKRPVRCESWAMP